MSSGGALTQLISTGAQDTYLETSAPSSFINYSCTETTSELKKIDDKCPIEDYENRRTDHR